MRKSSTGARCAQALVLSLLVSTAPARAGANLGNVLPLGDSITDGFNQAPGYRENLLTLLHNAGDTLNFVGSATDHSTSTLDAAGQAHHEGHSGYVIQNLGTSPGDAFSQGYTPPGSIVENLNTWLSDGTGVNPQYILLMISTNDVAYKYFLNGPNNDGVNDVGSRLSQLISQISNRSTGLRPNARLLVASLTTTSDDAQRPRFADFAAQVPGIVNAHKALGESVSYVDMYDALDPHSDFADWLHPSGSGYEKMAETWYNAINGFVLAPEPGSAVMLGLAAGGMLLRRRRRDQYQVA